MKRYFETYKEARSFIETVKVLDYGVKTINGQEIYWVLYEKDETCYCKAGKYEINATD